jgi:hypothetical protein
LSEQREERFYRVLDENGRFVSVGDDWYCTTNDEDWAYLLEDAQRPDLLTLEVADVVWRPLQRGCPDCYGTGVAGTVIGGPEAPWPLTPDDDETPCLTCDGARVVSA